MVCIGGVLANHLRHPPSHQTLPWPDHVAKLNDIQPLPPRPALSGTSFAPASSQHSRVPNSNANHPGSQFETIATVNYDFG